jgi:D-glycero-D-manno-heptose 1,7-bisphosphate phosphatase
MNKAIFLDRDGVINKMVFNPNTGEYESPHSPEDFELYPWTVETLLRFQEMNYLLFLVSNQPSYAKGKTSLENIKAIHEKFHNYIYDRGVKFTEYYYCYHHPHGIVPEYTGKCICRKPEPFFVMKAVKEFNIDTEKSWFIGDRDMDIFCGKAGGLKTILVNKDSYVIVRCSPDFVVERLCDTIEIVKSEK